MPRNVRRRTPAWIIILNLAYLTVLAALTVGNRLGVDRWWLGALNLYLPQALWVLPEIILFFVTWRVARRWIGLPLLGILWAVLVVMGFCWPLRRSDDPPPLATLRVMTWNVKYGAYGSELLQEEIARQKPTVVLIQDAGHIMQGELEKFFQKWHVRATDQYIVASRLPLDEIQELPLGSDEDLCARTRLKWGGQWVTLYDVHFQTPRWGLNALRVVGRVPRYFPRAVQELRDNVEHRLTQARALHEYLRRESGPVLVAGDLNAPDASAVCLSLREAGVHDAFAEGGKGYGYTYGHYLLKHRLPKLRASWMRLDHIMMSPDFETLRCWTGSATPSAHRPVVADLVLKGKQPRP